MRMTSIRVFLKRLSGFFRSRPSDAELGDEIQTHLQLLTSKHLARGLSLDAAQNAARREFGGVEVMKDTYRDQRGLPFLDALLQDIRYALRGMRRAPLFSTVAVLTLAIGIGANTAMFTLADALVLKPLPVERPDQLRAMYQVLRMGGRAVKGATMVPYGLYRNVREQSDAFTGTMAFAELDDLAIETEQYMEVRAAQAAFVSDNYFSVLGVAPRLGRAFAAGEDLPSSANRVVLLSDRFWRRAFGGNRDVLGRSIRVADNTFTIVGVTPPEFFGVILGRTPDVFLPLGSYGASQPGIVTV